MRVVIYRPAKTAMQSGRAKTHDWVLEFERNAPKRVDPLMGWTGSADTREQVSMRFPTLEEAVAFAQGQGWEHSVLPVHERTVRPKSYAANFSFRRARP